ncbi:hypothetical protein [Streptomyces sp. NPDC047123]|uniref:hypothetical protein n=1 Tax=Streptomyces sp. NPDC047123 TaxID=3155622 RepID=UPI00340A127D
MHHDCPPLLIDRSACDAEAAIWFAEPAGFTALPLGALLNAPESFEGEALRTALATVLGTAPDELSRQRFLGHFGATQQILATLCEMGTVYCAIGLHLDDARVDGDRHLDENRTEAGSAHRTLLSLLTLSWRDIAVAPPTVTAARAVASDEGDVLTGLEYIADASCGPVSLCETVRNPAAVTGLAANRLLQIHAHLPHPDGRRLAVLTLSTQAVHRRDDYRRMLRGSVDLVSFVDPFT